MRQFIFLFFLLISFSGSTQDFKSYVQSVPGTGASFKMVPVPAGSFIIGSPVSEPGRESDESQKSVEVSSFWVSATEVTFLEWDAYFKDASLPQSKNIDGVTRATPQYIDLTWGMGRDMRHPANSMSQLAAMMYCKWLFTRTGVFYRLPTEAEWEYACKKGSVPPNSPDLSGWYRLNSNGKFHPVEGKKPNALGIYDMLGNLSEWVLDQYDAGGYEALAGKDPLAAPASKYPRVTRGGSYMDEASALRCSNRIPSAATWNQRDPQIPKSKWWLTDGMFVGFRVVRPVKQPSEAEALRFYDAYLK
jgi:formylglycine-generating enzyme required for sulfatase activity